MTSGLTTNFLGGTNSLDLYKGLTHKFKVTVTSSSVAYDLTGATVYFTIKCQASDALNKLQKSSPSNGIVLAADPRDGYATVTFSAADTQALDPGTYVFDVVMETSGGERYLLVGPGRLNVYQGVTRF